MRRSFISVASWHSQYNDVLLYSNVSICKRRDIIKYLPSTYLGYKMGHCVCSICFLVILAIGDVVICGEDNHTTGATVNTTNTSAYLDSLSEPIYYSEMWKINLLCSYYHGPNTFWKRSKTKSNTLPSPERLQKCWWCVLWCWPKIMPLQTGLSCDRYQSMFQR